MCLHGRPKCLSSETKEMTFFLRKGQGRVEVSKLLEVGHICEVQFLNWLANMLLVPKVVGKWRIFMDF